MVSGRFIAGLAAMLVAGEAVHAVAANASSELLRPPGAQGESDFLSRCVKCGKCIEACPFNALVVAGPTAGASAGTPIIIPETNACRMCEDLPCLNACPTEALRDVEDPRDIRIGYAEVDEKHCIAYRGLRCEVCYRICPLIDEAITIEYEGIENDAIHMKFLPTIDKDVCTGCGLCVQRCTVRDPNVAIRIVGIAEQEKEEG